MFLCMNLGCPMILSFKNHTWKMWPSRGQVAKMAKLQPVRDIQKHAQAQPKKGVAYKKKCVCGDVKRISARQGGNVQV